MSARQLHEDEKNTLKLARAFEFMIKTEGWHYYKQILAARQDTHLKAILSPTSGIAEIFQGERDKGAAAALEFAIALTKVEIDEAEKIKKDIGEDPDAE